MAGSLSSRAKVIGESLNRWTSGKGLERHRAAPRFERREPAEVNDWPKSMRSPPGLKVVDGFGSDPVANPCLSPVQDSHGGTDFVVDPLNGQTAQAVIE